MSLRGHDLGRAPSKYKSIPTECDGIIFHSKKEAARYAELKMLQKVGIIKDLQWQVDYILFAHDLETGKPVKVGKWIADFVHESTETGRITVEDVKGFRTATYQLKKKIFEANYGMRIVET